ncbi:hypothetical protein ACQVBX_13350 [Dyella sp. KULCS107]|uniref:hypothetical protein n=1 Tax=Dyella sp. KULCS107 TaxID=3422216 RepID=UPI003D6E6281
MRRLAGTLVLASALLPSLAARAGASLLVDDAGTTPDGHCQLESWLRLAPTGAADASAVPACALGGVEYSLGGSVASTATPAELSFGLKHTLRDVGEATPGFAVSVGSAWSGHAGTPGAAVANLIASVPVPGLGLAHLNAGWSVARGHAPAPTFGTGLEHPLGSHWLLLAEGYVQRGASPAWQAGLRRMLGRSVTADLLMGTDPHGRWLTLGLNYSPGEG